jgi:hypothetical protein
MAQAENIKGFDKVIENLNKEIEKITERSLKGLIESVAYIREDMDKTEPLIPVAPKGGNLRASWFATPHREEKTLFVVCGFGANYAIYVHEMVDKAGKKINWSRPGSGPKFFESSVKRNSQKILEIIKSNVEIK